MRLDTRFALYELTDDEIRTATHIAQRASEHEGAAATMTLMPTHHVDERGQLHGFRLTASPQTPVGAAPFTQHMFIGIGLCECVVSPVDVARLIADAAACKSRLLALVDAIHTKSIDAVVAGMDCIPHDVLGVCKDTAGVSAVRSCARRAVDVKVPVVFFLFLLLLFLPVRLPVRSGVGGGAACHAGCLPRVCARCLR
jgi:hypothetical protein